MEESRMFIKGMHADFSQQNQPPDTYRDAHNWVRDIDGSLRAENGTIIFCENFPKLNVLGSLVLGRDMIFFLQGNADEHQIGWIDKDNIYHVALKSPDLNFSHLKLVKARGRVDYRGHRLIYFVDDRNPMRFVDLDRSYVGISDINSELKLQLDSKLANIKFVSVNPDGNVPSGIYQFSVRLKSSSGNNTMVSLPTNVIPIIADTTNSKLADGDEPQSRTSKSIVLSIDNIDTKYKFVEILMTTYEGTSNVQKTYVVGRRAIVGNTMNYTYYGPEQIVEDINTDEIVVEPIIYESGRHIEYKDGHLLIAGLKTKKEGTTFQNVANAIKVKYLIKELPYGDNIPSLGESDNEDYTIPETAFANKEGYHREENTVFMKGLMRDEVYSLSITPLYTNGTTGYAYHIPAPFINGNKYNAARPLFGSNGGECGTYLSEAVYPPGFGYASGESNQVRHHLMPSLEQEPIRDNGLLRILGLKLENIDLGLLPDDERATIQGYIIGYQRRSGINKRILTQGIAQPLVKKASGDKLVFVSPFHGKQAYSNEIIQDGGQPYYDTIAFYSPESVIYEEDFISADYIDRVATLKGRGILSGTIRSGGHSKEQANVLMNFTDYLPNTKTTNKIHKDTIQYIPTGLSVKEYTPRNFRLENMKVSTKGSNGFLFFHTETPLNIFTNTETSDMGQNYQSDIKYVYMSNATSGINMMRNGSVIAIDNNNGNNYADVTRAVFNLRADRAAQYGEVTDAEYIYMAHKMVDFPVTGIEVFNGDVFVNKVALMSTTAEARDSDDDVTGITFRTLNYLYLETTINTAYRHYTIGSGAENAGTIPYFPKYRQLWSKEGTGLFQVDPKLGHATAYNRQYSFDAGIKKFFPKPLLLEQEITNFDNRVIYSEVSLEGEQFDANRLFLPNAYHDVAKHKGNISDMFVHRNTLYFHTPQTLFRAFFNENTTQLSSSGELVLGNGGLFPRPSMETFTITGGYAGTSSPSGVNTPFGRIFIDEIQGKVFMLGESVNEISLEGMSNFFKGSLIELPDTLFHGYTSVYDYSNRRYLLSCKNQWTVSYMPELKSWSSFHGYLPTHMLSSGNRTFVVKKDTIEELNKGAIGKYFGISNDSQLEVVFNDNPLVTKVADNLFTQSSSNFNKIEVTNTRQSSGVLPINMVSTFEYDLEGYVIAKHKNGQYQSAVPRDVDGIRFRDKYNSFTLTSTNKLDSFRVRYLTLLYRVNHR